MYSFISLQAANDGKKKFIIKIFDERKNKVIKVKFGSFGSSDYTQHKNPQIKQNYIARHQVNELWTNPIKPGTLSRYILWNKPDLHDSLSDYLKRFNIKQFH